MSDDKVEMTVSFYRRSDGSVWERRTVGKHVLYDSIAMSFWVNVTSPRWWIPWQDPRSAILVIDGSCRITALVKEGPKALIRVAH